MGHHKSKRRKKREEEERLKKAQENTQGFSLSSLFADLDLKSLSGQIKNVAGYIETFNQVAELFKLADISGILKKEPEKEQGFNLISMLKDKDSINQILQTFSSNAEGPPMEASIEKKVNPLNVGNHQSEEE